jgi:hypothetical protein
VHGIGKAHPLKTGLDLVREYLSTTRDIVIFSSNHFEFAIDKSWPAEAHRLYREIIYEAFRGRNSPSYAINYAMAALPQNHASISIYHNNNCGILKI